MNPRKPSSSFPFYQHRTMADILEGERGKWVGYSRPTNRPPRRDRRRLTAEQVARIRKPDADRVALAREFGVSTVAVHYARHRYSYKDLP